MVLRTFFGFAGVDRPKCPRTNPPALKYPWGSTPQAELVAAIDLVQKRTINTTRVLLSLACVLASPYLRRVEMCKAFRLGGWTRTAR